MSEEKKTTFYKESELREKLKDFLSLLQADEKIGRITKDGEDFVTINRLAKELGIGYERILNIIDGVSSIEGRATNGKKSTFYKESELREKLKDFLSLLQADEKIGRITIDGEDFITIGRLAKEFEINRNIVSAAADGVQSFEARGVGGVKSTFYKESELREKLKDFLSLLQADEKTGRITKDGEDFVTIGRLAKELGISHSVISAAADGVSSIEGRATNGKKSTFYKESELREKLKDFLSLFQADEKTGRITKDGEDFITINRLAKELGIADQTISAAADGVQSFEARGVGGVKSTFYKESELREKLKDFLSLLQADEKTGRITKDGEDFVTIGRLAKELGISHSVISAAADGVSSIEGKGATGGKLLSTKNRNLERNSRISSLCFRRTRRPAESPKTERISSRSIVWQKSSALLTKQSQPPQTAFSL